MGCQNILRVKRKCETFTSLHFLEQAPYFLAIIPQKSVKYFGGDMKDAKNASAFPSGEEHRHTEAASVLIF
jgi:hypothetical protein